jgi:hypothetical protein
VAFEFEARAALRYEKIQKTGQAANGAALKDSDEKNRHQSIGA